MFTSVEKKLIEKDYKENLSGEYIWSYYTNNKYNM